MGRFIMLCGIPASGKSTYASKLKEEGFIIHSSDELRKELFGDVNEQTRNEELFIELNKRIKNDLLNNKNVVYDATNVNKKRRKNFLQEISGKKFKEVDIAKECHYVHCNVYKALDNNYYRDRSVNVFVIDKMYKSLDIPMYYEGWDKIEIIGLCDTKENEDISIKIEELVYTGASYDQIETVFKRIPCLKNTIDFPQDNPYHTLSLSRHIYYVYEYVSKYYTCIDKLELLYACLLHDVGKVYCKEFKEGSRYANYIGHEKVSGQLAVEVLSLLGYNQKFILNVVALIQNHMRMLNSGLKGKEKLFEEVGEELFYKLDILHKADTLAK